MKSKPKYQCRLCGRKIKAFDIASFNHGSFPVCKGGCPEERKDSK